MAAGEREMQRNRGVQPNGTATVPHDGGVAPGEQKTFATAQLVNDDDLQVGQNSIITFDHDAVICERAHECHFRSVARETGRRKQRCSPCTLSTANINRSCTCSALCSLLSARPSHKSPTAPGG